jgi:hypothetical protein
VIVAVAAVRMVQMAIDQIVHMTAVRDGFVPAIRAMDVLSGVAGAGVAGRAGVGVGGVDWQVMLVEVVAVGLMEVAVVHVVGVAVMLDGSVAATGSVDVGMVVVDLMRFHDCSFA